METRWSTIGYILFEHSRVRTRVLSITSLHGNREELKQRYSNLPRMPDSTLPYHMTSSRFGLVFCGYEFHYVALRNDFIEQTVIEAARKINQQLASNPNLANQALENQWVYVQEDYKYLLRFVPEDMEMTYGDIPIVLAVVSTWARQYAGAECFFRIWAWPGTSARREIGLGHLLLAS